MKNDKINKTGSWEERNELVKVYKTTGKFGWLHLNIGKNKITGKKFLRLKKYLNWFSIQDPEYLAVVQKILKKGAESLGWTVDEKAEVKIAEATEQEVASDTKRSLDKDDELITFLKEFPDFSKKVIALDLQSRDTDDVIELVGILDKAISSSGDRFKMAFKELIPKITTQNPKSMMELSDLMDKWNLYQITSLTNIIKTRLDTIETLEQMIHDEKTYELKDSNSIHRILENNMWLINEEYWIVQSNKSLRKFIGDELEKQDKKYKNRRPDFVCVNKENKIIILEIKRPSLILAKAELDQAELYQRIIKKYKAKLTTIEIYLIGNKISSEAGEIVELRKGVQIRTYQDFLDNCRAKHQEYLKVTEGQKK
jgi:hypothetical protein